MVDEDLGFFVAVGTVEPPPVVPVQVRLDPELAVVAADAEAAPIEVVEPDIWAVVDVVPVALVESMFAIRSPSLRFDLPRTEAMALLQTDIKAPSVRIEPTRTQRRELDVLSVQRRRPTPARRIPEQRLRTCLTSLFRASRLESPADLQVIGIYERIPGGAIASIALDGDTLMLTMRERARPRPATLVVGRARATGEVISKEIS